MMLRGKELIGSLKATAINTPVDHSRKEELNYQLQIHGTKEFRLGGKEQDFCLFNDGDFLGFLFL